MDGDVETVFEDSWVHVSVAEDEISAETDCECEGPVFEKDTVFVDERSCWETVLDCVGDLEDVMSFVSDSESVVVLDREMLRSTVSDTDSVRVNVVVLERELVNDSSLVAVRERLADFD